MIEKKIHDYNQSDDIDVTWDGKRCIHAKECVNRLSAVFDVDKRPWIQPQHADADTVAAVVETCPTGALQYTRKDGGTDESTPAQNTLRIVADGPIYLRGDIHLTDFEGNEILVDTRVAMCRCGYAKNKPLCDNSHAESGFTAGDNLANADNDAAEVDTADGSTPLTLHPSENGPMHVTGAFTMHSSDGETIYTGDDVWLCRCGGSQNKPFCDGTHDKIDFHG